MSAASVGDEPIGTSGGIDNKWTARIISVTPLAAGVVQVDLQPVGDEMDIPAWSAGSHIDLELRDGLTRQYSLVPTESTRLAVAVLRETDGRGGSAYVHDILQAGDEVRVNGPRNHFALEPSSSYHFVAGGIGITPLLRMIAEVDEAGAEWSLSYAGRGESTMAFVKELREAHPQQVQVFAADQGNRFDVGALVGTLAGGTAVYACGPTGLIDAVAGAVAQRPDLAMRAELFAPPDVEQLQENQPFQLYLQNSDQMLEVAAEQSALDVLEDAGHFILSSCREGTCGSCEVRVLAGKVDHRDWVLTEEQRAQNNTMFVCVSRAHSAQLTLDL